MIGLTYGELYKVPSTDSMLVERWDNLHLWPNLEPESARYLGKHPPTYEYMPGLFIFLGDTKVKDCGWSWVGRILHQDTIFVCNYENLQAKSVRAYAT